MLSGGNVSVRRLSVVTTSIPGSRRDAHQPDRRRREGVLRDGARNERYLTATQGASRRLQGQRLRGSVGLARSSGSRCDDQAGPLVVRQHAAERKVVCYGRMEEVMRLTLDSQWKKVLLVLAVV